MIIRINILIASHGTVIRSSKKLFKPAYKTQINPKPFKVLKNRRKMFKNPSLPLMQSTSSLSKTNTHKLGIKGPLAFVFDLSVIGNSSYARLAPT